MEAFHLIKKNKKKENKLQHKGAKCPFPLPGRKGKMKQPEFKVYLQFLYKHQILNAIQNYYESNSWTITDNNKIVNTLTGEVLPFLIRIKNGNYQLGKIIYK